ncbi:MAG TPA: hypothetical protein VE990_07930 [Acidimicrobiales bacterium]|nr:hypothetical protein [Acidimicrobiales bacterium]
MSNALEQARERRAGLRAAMGDVERSLASPAAGRTEAWVKTLAEDLRRLSTALDLHIEATEAPDGLLADVVSSAPRLANRADQARRDHQNLRYRLHTAQEALTAGPEPDLHEVRERVVEVLAGIVHHRHLGADLVYEAFNVDIEAAD